MTPERNKALGTAIGSFAGFIAELNDLGRRITALENKGSPIGPQPHNVELSDEDWKQIASRIADAMAKAASNEK